MPKEETTKAYASPDPGVVEGPLRHEDDDAPAARAGKPWMQGLHPGSSATAIGASSPKPTSSRRRRVRGRRAPARARGR